MTSKPKARRKPALTFESWKAACNKAADALGLHVGDLFGPTDDYDLREVSDRAYKAGQTPRAFVEEMFDEDLARNEYENDLCAQSLMEED